MLLYIGEPHYKIITAVKGTGDNLTSEDKAEGLKDYWMSSVYEQDGDELKLVDAGQIMTSKLIKEMDDYEAVDHVREYWEVQDAPYSILEH